MTVPEFQMNLRHRIVEMLLFYEEGEEGLVECANDECYCFYLPENTFCNSRFSSVDAS